MKLMNSRSPRVVTMGMNPFLGIPGLSIPITFTATTAKTMTPRPMALGTVQCIQ